MTIITCQGCGAQVESKTHNRKWCEACHRERVRRWRAANREKIREQARRYYWANPDKHREQRRERRRIRKAQMIGAPLAGASSCGQLFLKL
jgi:hypothetical protein